MITINDGRSRVIRMTLTERTAITTAKSRPQGRGATDLGQLGYMDNLRSEWRTYVHWQINASLLYGGLLFSPFKVL